MKQALKHQHGVCISPDAAKKLKEMQKNHNRQTWGLRFSDKQGLCGKGFEYCLEVEAAPKSEDLVFLSEGIAIYVPKESLARLGGSLIEFQESNSSMEDKEGLEKVGFKIINPNVKGPCPCQCSRGVDL